MHTHTHTQLTPPHHSHIFLNVVHTHGTRIYRYHSQHKIHSSAQSQIVDDSNTVIINSMNCSVCLCKSQESPLDLLFFSNLINEIQKATEQIKLFSTISRHCTDVILENFWASPFLYHCVRFPGVDLIFICCMEGHKKQTARSGDWRTSAQRQTASRRAAKSS